MREERGDMREERGDMREEELEKKGERREERHEAIDLDHFVFWSNCFNKSSLINLVRNISARHNVLLDTIGPREEEVECYERALWYFWTVIITFLVCSLLELLLYLVYSYKVSCIKRYG